MATDVTTLIDEYVARSGTALSRWEVVAVLDAWRDALHANGFGEVELAGPFQRHYLTRGTGIPPNLCLAIAGDTVKVFKFNPRNGEHPLGVRRGQIRGHVTDWPRNAVKVTAVDPAKMALNLTLEVDPDRTGPITIPCRTPRLSRNPAAAVMVMALGGTIPPT